jgi:peptide/nickel transport system permease protein
LHSSSTLRYIGNRTLAVVPLAVGVAVLSFLILQLVPGTIVDVLIGEAGDTRYAEELKRLFGLDRPFLQRLVEWFGALLRGDLGHSMRTREPVVSEIVRRLPATIELTLVALLVSMAIAVPVGALSAARPNTAWDVTGRTISLLGLSLPSFWLALLLILVLSVKLRWIPSGGFVPFGQNPVENLKLVLMPALALGTGMSAIVMRMTRSAMLEVLRQDYVRTAVAKGLGQRAVTYRHAFRNALIPVMTVVGIQTGRLLGGTVIIEQIFSWPGMGQLALRSIALRDYPMVQGTVLFGALFFILINLLVDILYAYVDPRIRYA